MNGIFRQLAMLLFFHVASAGVSFGQLKPLARYNTGNSGSITFAEPAGVLKDLSGNAHDLHRSGAPLFFADAPADRRLAGEGSILFKGSASYSAKKAIASPGERFILEAWVKPVVGPDESGSVTMGGIVAYGDSAKGYMLAQAGSNWVLRVDGEKIFTIGRVVPD
ncbi:MAG TPA: hypothetical protein VGM31_17780, partial [Puia sp.]